MYAQTFFDGWGTMTDQGRKKKIDTPGTAIDLLPWSTRGKRKIESDRDSAGDVSVVGQPVVLVGTSGLEDVPMRMPAGVCGLTVTQVGLEDGIPVVFVGIWRARYGPASQFVGDVVVEIVPETAPMMAGGTQVLGGARETVRVCVSVAGHQCWETIGDVRGAGPTWPFDVATLAAIAGAPWVRHNRRLHRG